MSKFPAPLSSGFDGAMVANIGKYHRQAVSTAFEMCGGVERLADWADKNYGEFITKLYPRLIPKEVEATVTAEGVEDLIRRLDAGEHAPRVIEGSVTRLDEDA